MSRLKISLLLSFFIFSVYSNGQGIDHEFDIIDFKTSESNRHFTAVTDMELSPSGEIVAMSNEQSGPIVLWDWKNRKILKEFDTKGYYAGPKISFSPSGNYLLLEQQFYIDWKPNKDKPVRVEVMDLSNGQIIFRKNNVNDAAFLSEDYIGVLNGDDIKVYPLDKSAKASENEEEETGLEFKKKLKVESAKNAFTASPDAKILAVARAINSKDIKNIASLRSDKKAQKLALKYKYVVDFYDSETLKLLNTSNESFDIIFDMKFTQDGSDLIVFSKAHTKLNTGTQGFINLVDAKTGEMKRAMFNTFAPLPDYKESEGKKYMGVVTMDTDNMWSAGSILWSNYETGRNIGKFDVDFRFKDMIGTNGRTYFVFLPNGEILTSYGHHLAYVKPKL